MSTRISLYVRLPTSAQRAQGFLATREHLEQAARKLRGRFEVRLEPSSQWVEIRCPGFGIPVEAARRLSAELSADVVGLVVQTNADVLELSLFRGGEPTRELAYSRDGGGWIRNQGQPLPWEADVFFAAGARDDDLEDAKDDEDRRRIERVYTARELQVGSDLPFLSTRAAAEAIARELGLPGFDGVARVPEYVQAVRRVPALDIVSYGLLGAGLVLTTLLAWQRNEGWSLIGFPLIWAGVAGRLRRSSRVVSVGLGFIAAIVLFGLAMGIAGRQ